MRISDWSSDVCSSDLTVPALRGNPALTLGSEDSVAARPADLLVVDHYGLDALWETPQRRWASSILVLDDLADRRHDCDFLVDQTFGRAVADYDSLLQIGSASGRARVGQSV